MADEQWPEFDRTRRFSTAQSHRRNKSESNVILRALRPFLFICQIGGLYPVKIDVDMPFLTYRVKSWRGFYAVLCTVSVCVFGFPSVGICITKILNEPDNWVNSATTCIIQMHMTGTYLFMVLFTGKPLTDLLARWLQIEDEMRYNVVILTKNTVYKCWAFTTITFVLIVTEDSLFLAPQYASISKEPEGGFANFLEGTHSYGKHWAVGAARMINEFFVVIGWAFIDCFVLQLSVILQENFLALNRRLGHWKNLSLRKKEDLRLCYHNVIMLSRDADRILGPIVLLGSLCNIVDLILLIYSGFFKDIFSEDMVKKITAVLASTYLLGRTIAACYYSGSLSEQAREALRLTGEVRFDSREETSKNETLLINRFTHQLNLPLGFTGNGFFSLNLAYLIVVGSTVLTYEILLLQMNGKNPSTCALLNVTT